MVSRLNELYSRLDANAHPDTNIVTNQKGFNEMIQELKADTDQGLSVGIGGGVGYGLTSFTILHSILKNGIEPKEYVGNSIGAIIATLFALGYTDPKHIDFFFAWLGDISSSGIKESLTPGKMGPIVIAKLLPFVCDISIPNLQHKLFHENERFLKYLQQTSIGSLFSENIIDLCRLEEILTVCYPECFSDVTPFSGFLRKISFNDVKKGWHGLRKAWEGVGLRVLAGTFTTKKRPKRGATKDAKKSRAYELIFRGSYPVFDALIASANPDPFSKRWASLKQFGTNNKLRIRATDGAFVGKWYPSEVSDFQEEGTRKLIIHTDDKFIVTRHISPDYGAWIDYVIRPDMRDLNCFDLTPAAREVFHERAINIIGGDY